MAANPLRNALTIDVDDAPSAYTPGMGPENGGDGRIEPRIERLLEILGEHGNKATFFVLGLLAERCPQMIRRIVADGHELASHGYASRPVDDQSPEAFLADIRLARILLEDISGSPVLGYRAPGFSIGAYSLWAFECLERAGYRYSSSLCPRRNEGGRVGQVPRFAHQRRSLLELPVTTLQLANCAWPASSGERFRLVPYPFLRWMLRRINDGERQPAVFHFRPEDLDPGLPQGSAAASASASGAHVVGGRADKLLHRLLGDFAWGRMDGIFLGAG